MYEMKSLLASDLLEYLNNNKGEVIYLEDIHNDYWTLIFRKSVVGRPPKKEPNIQDVAGDSVSASGRAEEADVPTVSAVQQPATTNLGFPDHAS